MGLLIDNNKMLSVVDRYYLALESTGYVKHSTVEKLLIYEFITEFVQNTYFFITEEDYNIIDSVLRKLFANGGCLFSYPVFCANRVKLSGYAADGEVRITEDETLDIDGNFKGNEIRVTEDNKDVRVA